MLGKNLIEAAAGAGAAAGAYIEDVFSTYLYTGNGSTQTITNGIDLAGEGGLVWIKGRSTGASNALQDTVRGANNWLVTNATFEQETLAFNFSFNSTGFSQNNSYGVTNTLGATYATWTFRKAEKFFDVVTYTGNGSNRSVAHNLGSVPGTIIIKRTDTSENWVVWHRSLGTSDYLSLNLTNGKETNTFVFNTLPTSSLFYVGANGLVNQTGGTYVAYLFAHDAGGFGDSGNESVIKCGSYTHGSGVTEVNVGFEPQWLLIKRTDTSQSWYMFDNMRGWTADANRDAQYVSPNSPAEEAGIGLGVFANGFRQDANQWGSGGNYIYIAIRRGPMKTPEDATEVFNSVTYTGDGATGRIITTNILTDLFINCRRTGAQNVGIGYSAHDRIRGDGGRLTTYSTTAESSNSVSPKFDLMDGIDLDGFNGGAYNASSAPYILHAFRRAPGFFDVVAYTGNGVSGRAISHNLGVAPELIITKRRDAASILGWIVSSKYYFDSTLWDRNGRLNQNTGLTGGGVYVPASSHSATQYPVSSFGDVNASGGTYISYLFATCPGVSKVGGYTGTGTTLNIDCGFAAGARFVLIKRADSTGDWYVWDTVRGIVSGNDPYLLLNDTAAEVTNTDYIDPLASGFQISGSAPAAINASGGSYIFLAIA